MDSTQPKISLLEVLVVVAIIGLVGLLAVFAVNAARSKERDSTRLANVRQIQSGLEDFFNENNAYPTGAALPLGDSTLSACLGVSGFLGNCSAEKATIMRTVPRTYEDGLHGAVACGSPARNAFCYSASNQGASYAIQIELENPLVGAGLQKGVNCAVPGKMTAGACP